MSLSGSGLGLTGSRDTLGSAPHVHGAGGHPGQSGLRLQPGKSKQRAPGTHTGEGGCEIHWGTCVLDSTGTLAQHKWRVTFTSE